MSKQPNITLVANLTDTNTSQTSINSSLTNIQTSFNNTVSIDGSAPNQMQSNFDMNGKRILNLPAPTSATDPVRLQDLTAGVGVATFSALSGDVGGSTVVSGILTNTQVNKIQGTAVTGTTGSGNVVLSSNAAMTTPTITSPTLTTPSMTSPVITSGGLTITGNIAMTGNDNITGNYQINSNPVVSSVTNYTQVTPSNGTTSSFMNLGNSVDPNIYLKTSGGSVNFQTVAGATGVTVFTAPGNGISFFGSGSGSTELVPQATASGFTVIPSTSGDQLVCRATTDTLTNKTFDTGGVGNVFKISGTTATTTANFQSALFMSRYNIIARGVNFNAANNDNSITVTLPTGVLNYKVGTVTIANASASISTATFNVFTAAAGGGIGLFTATQAITVTSGSVNTNNNAMTVATTNSNTETFNAANLFFRTIAAQGSAATADVLIEIIPC